MKMGVKLPKSVDKGIMVLRGETSTYEHTRIKGSKICNSNFLQGERQKLWSAFRFKLSLPDENRRSNP